MAEHYKDAGVDVHAGYDTVRRIKSHTASTFNEDVLSGHWQFWSLLFHWPVWRYGGTGSDLWYRWRWHQAETGNGAGYP